MRRLLALGVLLAATGTTVASAQGPFPVTKLSTKEFGAVLARTNRLPLYYWTPEKRDHRIHCTGGCATVWPPLTVDRKATIPAHIAGFKGRFGTITRPDGRRQLTYKRLPLYTYHADRPGIVLCNNVNGWFVVRV
jgi:predicted lipoprotein with Yx(FWY)xxD motif